VLGLSLSFIGINLYGSLIVNKQSRLVQGALYTKDIK
jgi:hypothetical protein